MNDPAVNYACPSAAADCSASRDLALAGSGIVSPFGANEMIVGDNPGTPGLGSAAMSLTVFDVTFQPLSGTGPQVFTDLSYGVDIPVSSSPAAITQTGPATGTITGFLNTAPFSVQASVSGFSCSLSGGPFPSGTCSVTFGAQGFTVGGHDWVHTFSLAATESTPEPGATGLVLFGLLALAQRQRRTRCGKSS